MARYTYNDAEMDAIIETFARSRQAFVLVHESISQALGILRSVNSAGGDLSSAVDGTVLGNVNQALNQADAVLESLTGLLGRLNEARALLSRPGTRPDNEDTPPYARTAMANGMQKHEGMASDGLLRELTNNLLE